jgi:hypothetical protein
MLLVFNEWRAEAPIMPLRLFASHERAGAYASRALFLGAMMGFWFFTTQYLQGVLGFGPFQAGVAFLPMTIANFAVAMAVPRLTHKLGNARLLAVGLVVTLVGMAWLSRLSAQTTYLTGIALPMILIGMGQGGTLGPLTVAGVSGVAAEDAGAASGLVNVAHWLGGSLCLGMLVVVFATAGVPTPNAAEQLAHKVSMVLSGSVVLLLLALIVVSWQVVRLRKGHSPMP